MTAKLLMRWDVRPESENEYFEFLVHEFIPGMNRLGVVDVQVWYTQFGECEQKLASGVTPSLEKMRHVLGMEDWDKLRTKLEQFVENYEQKVVNATGGFQI